MELYNAAVPTDVYFMERNRLVHGQTQYHKKSGHFLELHNAETGN